MKKLFLVPAVAILFFSAVAQQTEKKMDKKNAVVPEAVKVSFEKKFPGTKAKWEKEGDGYEANFTKSGDKMSAVFLADGTITETETAIKTSELPTAVINYIKQNRKNASIKEAAKIIKADGQINYEAEVMGKDMVFDADGNFLKETKD